MGNSHLACVVSGHFLKPTQLGNCKLNSTTKVSLIVDTVQISVGLVTCFKYQAHPTAHVSGQEMCLPPSCWQLGGCKEGATKCS